MSIPALRHVDGTLCHTDDWYNQYKLNGNSDIKSTEQFHPASLLRSAEYTSVYWIVHVKSESTASARQIMETIPQRVPGHQTPNENKNKINNKKPMLCWSNGTVM